MGSINATLMGAASALEAFQYALNTSQNNIDNASTPGYAKQIVALEADPFDPAVGLSGGVTHGPLIDSRDVLAENDVWQQSGAQGDATGQSSALTVVQNAIPVAQGTGIPAALNTFFADISAWSASPSNAAAQQNVMVAAGALAQSFQATAAAVSNASNAVTQDIHNTVNQVNSAINNIATLNGDILHGGQGDAGMQAQLYNSLETLSGLVNINVLSQADGTMDVTLSNGAALVMGNKPYGLTASNAAATAQSIDPQAPPDIVIQAADGAVVTNQITSGTLAGLLQVRNVTIPGLIGDASQPGALNQLASSLSDAVNAIVSQGSTTPGGAQVGIGLFTTPDPAHPTSAAATMAVNPNMTASQLPPVDQNGVSNGVPLALADLANASPAELGSVDYTTYYANAAAAVGSQLDQAQSNQTMTAQTLAQAQSMRQSESSVSLNAEAINVLQYQAGYQAVAKMVNTLSTLTQSLLDMLP